ncbi:MAG: class I SAM-dependent methyltransferase [Steroidobacteraceae bacterium]
MSKVSVDLDTPSPYIEVDSWPHRFKRKLSYAFAFNLIKKFKPGMSHGAILEVGTGSGFFLSFCHRFMPAAKLYGIEYDERLLEVTKQRAPFAECKQGNAETFDLNPIKFDVVVSFQVIEHLYHPDEMLKRVRDHLKPDGLFIVTTPNLNGVGARVMGQKWHGYRDDHVSLKGMGEWVKLIESHGFKTQYAGSTFFTGIPIMNRLPLGVINWGLLYLFDSWRWTKGESFVGAFYRQ